jgi:uncharacterized protein (TIGR00369 family)
MAQSGFLDALRMHLPRWIPHARACGMQIVELDATQAILSMPYRETWLADTERGLIHPGAISTLVDTTCGVALMAAVGQFERIATLDLRLDYLRPALAPKVLYARAECFRLTSTIAFVRGSAWQDDRNEPCAVSQAAFMRLPLKLPPK